MDWTAHLFFFLLFSIVIDLLESACQVPEAPENGSRTVYGTNVGDTTVFSCSEGYYRHGSNTLICMESGDWSNVVPICDLDRCKIEPLPCKTHEKSYCHPLIGSFVCLCSSGLWNGSTCLTCLKTWDPPITVGFSHDEPIFLDGVVEAVCTDCGDYDSVTYEWTLGKNYNTTNPIYIDTCVLLKENYTTLMGASVDFSCDSPTCDNILNGGDSVHQLKLVLTVTAHNNSNIGELIQARLTADVFVRDLPLADPSVRCTLVPDTPTQSFPTDSHLNCDSLHQQYKLYDHRRANYYVDNPKKFRKEFSIESQDNTVLETYTFIEPISQTFVLPPGDPATVRLTVYDNGLTVFSQVIQKQVQTDYKSIDEGDFSLVYKFEEDLKDENSYMYPEMRVHVVTKLKKSNISSIEEMTTTTELINIVTERSDWMDDVDKKASTVDVYSSLSKTFEELSDDIPEEEIANKSGVLLKGVATTLDFIIDVENETESNTSDMSVLVNKLMDSLDTVCGSSLKKLPITEEPTVLYSSPSTMLFVQNTNNSGLGGTKLNVDSENATESSVSLEFPDDLEINTTNKLSLQMIYQKRNPFVFEKPSLKVTAPVLTVTLKDQTGHIVEVEHLRQPVKYKTHRTSTILDIGHINVTYTNNNSSNNTVDNYKSDLLYLKFPFKRGEIKMFNIILPTNVSNVLVYGQPLTIPDNTTVINEGFLFPKQRKQIQAFFGNYSYKKNMKNKNTNNNLYVSANESLFGGNASYDMYIGIALDLQDDKLLGLLNMSFAECINSTEVDCTTEVQLSFSMVLDSLFCVFWDPGIHDWSTRGCRVNPTDNTKHLECHCDHLSSFSTSSFASEFLVVPVMIDLNKDIMLFLTFFDNPVVVTVVIVVWVIYFFAVHWARRFDRKDVEQVGVLNCEDNTSSERYLYVICVMTGWWNQAGTTANVYMSITGESGSSSKKRLSNNSRLCFQNGFEDWFVFATEASLGSLQTVTIWHDNAGSSPHWYLNQVYVRDLQSRMVWNFIYNDWLAVDRGDLRQTTTTIQAVTEEDMKFKQKYNFALISSRNLRESHLWVSIISKPPQSSFTRVQRLTCGLSLLLTMMLTNIMFYGLPSDTPGDQLKAGGFSFNLRQFIIGIESSIIMFPVNFIVLQLFIRVKPKPPKERKVTVNSQGQMDTGPSYQERLLWFYRKLYNSGMLKKDQKFQDTCMSFDEKLMKQVGDLMVAKHIQNCSRNIVWKAMNIDSERDKLQSDIDGLVQAPSSNLSLSLGNINGMNRNRSNCCGKEEQQETSDNGSTKEKPLLKKKGVKKVFICLVHYIGGSGGMKKSPYIGVAFPTYLPRAKFRDESSRRWALYNVLGMFMQIREPNALLQRTCGNINRQHNWLPWWFLYISWFIVIGSCLTSSFFVMLYGLKYGYTRSVEWIVSFITGFLQGVLLEQPLKVIGLAVVLALILHKQADIEEYGPDLELAENEEYVSDVLMTTYKHQPFVEPMSHSLLARIKERIRIEWLMDVTIRDLVLYAVYLSVVLMMVHGHNNHHTSYLNSQTVYRALVKPTDGVQLKQVTSPHKFYTYMQETFVPVMEDLAVIERNQVSQTADHYLLGFYRVRQVRTKTVDCPEALPRNLVTRCVCEYSISNEDTENYAGSWSNVTRVTEPGPWTYSDSWNLKTLPYPGLHATYSGGGYIQLLRANASEIFTDLENKGWLDERTRAVFVDCTLYNPNVGIFTLVTLLFEMTHVGVMYPKYEILSTKLHHYSSDTQKVVAVCEGLFACFNILFLFIEIQKWRKLGREKYFSDNWSIVEWLQIALSFTVIGLFIKRVFTVSDSLDRLADKKSDKMFINFNESFFWNSVLEYVMAFLVAISISKSIKLARFNARMKLINATISKIKPDLFGFIVLFSVVMMAYAHCGYLLFGRGLGLYKNIHHSFFINVQILLGSQTWLVLQDFSAIFGPMFLISYVISICYIGIQVLSTILNAGRIVTKFELAGKNDFELMDYVVNKVKLIASRK